MKNILSVSNLYVSFDTFDGEAKALRNISLSVSESEALGLVGETGSGKTVLSYAILRVIPHPGRIKAGKIIFQKRNLLNLSEKEMNLVRGIQISMIPQSPMTSLNPIIKVRTQMVDVIRRQSSLKKSEASEQAKDLLSLVGLPDPQSVLEKYPYELSGGMSQRVVVAMAVSAKPALLIADEPTTALDVTVQKQIIRLINNLRERLKSTLIWISHDLGVIKQICDRIAILYAGTIVEIGPTKQILNEPFHPYTKALIEAIPTRRKRGTNLKEIKGYVSSILSIPAGCIFASRCDYVKEECTKGEAPSLIDITNDRRVACRMFEGVNRV